MTTSKMKFSRRQLLAAGGVFAVTSLNQDGPFTPRQKAIIYGNILGDGHLQLSPNGKTARLRFNHTARHQNYVEWQYKELDWLCEGVQKPKPVFEHQGKHIICRAYTNDMLRAALWDNFGVQTSKDTFGEYESFSIPVRGGVAKRFVNLFADTVKKEIPSMAYKVNKYIS